MNASLIDMGNRFRLIVNEVEAVEPMADLPKLPVARVLWDAKPSLMLPQQHGFMPVEHTILFIHKL